MACPEYYRLIDGRELCDLTCNELNAYLSIRVSANVQHCIISALEHRYRNGMKDGIPGDHDEKAEKWWMEKARDLYFKETGNDWFIGIQRVCELIVDIERELKLRQISF